MSPATAVPSSRSDASLRKAKNAQRRERTTLTEEILKARQEAKRAAAEAAALTQAGLTQAEYQAWQEDIEARLAQIQKHPEQHLGFIEEAIARASKPLQRLLVQRAAQVKANTTPCQCHLCHTSLTDIQTLRRSIDSRFGSLEIWRSYGWCPKCEDWDFPADHALGLAKNAPASPYLQEMAALLTAKMPPEQAVLVAERLGLDMSRCFLHREAHRQGLKAQDVRTARLDQLDTWQSLQELAHSDSRAIEPFTLVIEIDAWNIRERDNWGETQTMKTMDPHWSRWHWVYVATVFRLNHRGQTDGGRAIISERGYAATRLGIDALMRQLYRQAIDCGLGQAKEVLVIADGAVWIWNAAKDRFPQARNRLDLYHADEHLWEVAHELYGKGTPEARNWVQPLLKQLRNDDHVGMIQELEELSKGLNKGLKEKVQKQIDYFEKNKNRMNYREIIKARRAVDQGKATEAQKTKANEPLGSGAVESTCRQYQCRFKRTGQFWTLAGDEALMCIETFWRNSSWHLLFPHSKAPSPANN